MNTALKQLLVKAACEVYTRETGLAASSAKDKITLWNDQNKKIIVNQALTKQVQNIIIEAIHQAEKMNRKVTGEA